MKVLDAAKIAKARFNRKLWLSRATGWRTDRRGWRQVVRNVQRLTEERGYTLADFE